MTNPLRRQRQRRTTPFPPFAFPIQFPLSLTLAISLSHPSLTLSVCFFRWRVPIDFPDIIDTQREYCNCLKLLPTVNFSYQYTATALSTPTGHYPQSTIHLYTAHLPTSTRCHPVVSRPHLNSSVHLVCYRASSFSIFFHSNIRFLVLPFPSCVLFFSISFIPWKSLDDGGGGGTVQIFNEFFHCPILIWLRFLLPVVVILVLVVIIFSCTCTIVVVVIRLLTVKKRQLKINAVLFFYCLSNFILLTDFL